MLISSVLRGCVDLEAHVTEQDRQIQSLMQQLDQTRAQVTATAKDMSIKVEELAQFKAAATKAAADHDRCRAALGKAQSQTAQVESAMRHMQREVAEAKEAANARVLELEDEVRSLEKENTRLRSAAYTNNEGGVVAQLKAEVAQLKERISVESTSSQSRPGWQASAEEVQAKAAKAAEVDLLGHKAKGGIQRWLDLIAFRRELDKNTAETARLKAEMLRLQTEKAAVHSSDGSHDVAMRASGSANGDDADGTSSGGGTDNVFSDQGGEMARVQRELDANKKARTSLMVRLESGTFANDLRANHAAREQAEGTESGDASESDAEDQQIEATDSHTGSDTDTVGKDTGSGTVDDGGGGNAVNGINSDPVGAAEVQRDGPATQQGSAGQRGSTVQQGLAGLHSSATADAASAASAAVHQVQGADTDTLLRQQAERLQRQFQKQLEQVISEHDRASETLAQQHVTQAKQLQKALEGMAREMRSLESARAALEEALAEAKARLLNYETQNTREKHAQARDQQLTSELKSMAELAGFGSDNPHLGDEDDFTAQRFSGSGPMTASAQQALINELKKATDAMAAMKQRQALVTHDLLTKLSGSAAEAQVLRQQIKELTKERDEARSAAAKLQAEVPNPPTEEELLVLAEQAAARAAALAETLATQQQLLKERDSLNTVVASLLHEVRGACSSAKNLRPGAWNRRDIERFAIQEEGDAPPAATATGRRPSQRPSFQGGGQRASQAAAAAEAAAAAAVAAAAAAAEARAAEEAAAEAQAQAEFQAAVMAPAGLATQYADKQLRSLLAFLRQEFKAAFAELKASSFSVMQLAFRPLLQGCAGGKEAPLHQGEGAVSRGSAGTGCF
eukprot:TRINITY_DN3762_c0_g1_i4.p1 TRINITY_DN3762_c0_g1~~TRINITY_DN3762_c0_g1_i4.p1  ORF type:complete len:855 (-),score=285.07 TRINITY_DN3762_c0_g1_i4:1254-3818(-)